MFQQQFLEESAETQSIQWAELIRENLSDPEATFAYGKISEDDAGLIALVTEAGGVYRYKFYNQDGVVVLASRLNDLGTKNTKPYFYEIVAQGDPFVKIEHDVAATEIQPEVTAGGEADYQGHEQVAGRHLAVVAEAYVPMIEQGRFLGAIEVYVDASTTAVYLEKQMLEAQLGLVAILAVLGIFMTIVIRSNMRERNRELATMSRAHESMAKAEEQVARLNQELEQRVEERTAELERANQDILKANEDALRASEDVQRLNSQLEQRVEERTAQLNKAYESMAKLNDQLEQRVDERTTQLGQANESVMKLNQELEHRVEERTAELHQAQGELLRRERLAALGQLTATVSHELRNPLGAIRTAVYLIRGRTDDKGLGVEAALERADRSITRCDNIITELLDFTRTTDLSLENFRVGDWLDRLLYEQNAPEGVTVRNEMTARDLEVAFDEDRFRRVVINVFNNACEAMSEDYERTGRQDYMLGITSRVSEDRFELIFHDNGPGIAPDTLEKIWEPLFSTKSFGVGLGLPTVKQIMQQHAGGIDITSNLGQGTDVVLWLPLNRLDERAA
ncbi:MAG: ATP-binding protein [Rhodospirillales bacterium]|nr:ATP-binding protein [Rhodospirillales bacterium]MDH3919224.1 ATP-binding protein [Rhodospirillales bacterium]MDH3969975.1 ATP-binding protein [Rhodospirillales bacterium]